MVRNEKRGREDLRNSRLQRQCPDGCAFDLRWNRSRRGPWVSRKDAVWCHAKALFGLTQRRKDAKEEREVHIRGMLIPR